MDSYDYIIVGAGSAGCVLANRLSADGQNRVLLLEAGGEDRHPYFHMPKAFAKLVLDQGKVWHFPVAQPREPGREASEVWVRGKALGGSSSVNGMIYSRGDPKDYDDWETLGGDGWGWSDIKKAYRSIEDHELGAADYRGSGGAVHVSSNKFRYPIAEAMVEAGEQMGLNRKQDLNDPGLEGVGYYAHTIKKGKRVSSARAFLKAARKRPNLRVQTHAHVDRVIIENHRAVGVAARVRGEPQEFSCRGEVILSAGAILSPKILQLSGVGPADHLRSLGIEVVSDSPDVGARMREHLGFSMPHRLLGGPGLNKEFQGIGLARNVAKYYATRSGAMATGPFEVGAFVKVMPDADRPDAQLYLGAFTYARTDDNFPVQLNQPDSNPGMTIYGQLVQCTSEGSVLINSPDPDAPPEIKPNWLSTENDQQAAIAMFKFMRRYVRQPALEPYAGDEMAPGPQCQTDEEILKAFRIMSTSGLHGVATCRMGKDNSAVVDNHLRVRGIEGLRVVDCSIMPGLISGNTNGPAMAVGWRASDVILEDQKTTVA
jgi:choline dehydrogenase-like flavoprotein